MRLRERELAPERHVPAHHEPRRRRTNPRRPDDSRPPWWTPSKFLALVVAHALVILLVGAGNVSLRALVERRSRALNRESIARVTSDLKVYERTRLAVELHDSIAQSLTGVSLEIRTARRLAQTDAAAFTIVFPFIV